MTLTDSHNNKNQIYRSNRSFPLSKLQVLTLCVVLLTGIFARAQTTGGAAGSGTSTGTGSGTAAQPAGRTGTVGAGSAASQGAAQTGNQPTNATIEKAKAALGTEKGKAAAGDATQTSEGTEATIKDAKGSENSRIVLDANAELRRKIYGTQIFSNPNISFVPSDNVATPRDYTIGPNDELNVYIYGYSQNKFALNVNSDGFVFVDRVGAVQLSGRTIEQAQKELIQRMSSFYLNLGAPGSGSQTTLQVTLGRIRSIKVFVLGEVVAPGTYELSSLSTALNALYQSGGPNEIGSFRAINVVRRNKVVATIDIYELLNTGALANDMRLQDNDVVQVSSFKKRIELKGEVKRPGIYELLPDENLAKVLEYAGGFTESAYSSRVKVLGNTSRERRIDDVKSEEYAKYIPKNGDEIGVDKLLDRYENMVTLSGAVYRPGRYSLDQNKSLLQLVSAADGLTGDAFTGRVNIIRTREDLSLETISINLADMINKKTDDLLLQREDQIVIPSKFELSEGATVTIRGDLIAADLVTLPYGTNMTLEDAIVRAGGVRESAAISQVEVVRRRRDVNLQSTSAQIADIFSLTIDRDFAVGGKGDSQFILAPFDEVVIRKSSSYQNQTFITIEGEALSPGNYGLKNKDEKLSDLIARSGGLTAQAYPKGATLVRTVKLSLQEVESRQKAVNEIADDAKKGVFQAEQVTNLKQEAIGIDLTKILENPGGKEDIILEDGDIIRIPKRLETVRLQGELLFPTTVKYRGGSFMDYVSQAGGFTRTSLKRKSYVLYPNGSVDRTRKFLFFNIYPKVEPGSEIIVPQRTASDLLEAQKALGSVIGISSTLMTLVTTLLAFKVFSNP